MTNRIYMLAGISGLILYPGVALAKDGVQLDVSAGAITSRNPFLQSGNDTTAAAFFIQLDPKIRATDEVSSTVLGATLRLDRYTQRYGESASARVGLDVTRRASDETTLRAHASGRTSRTSALDFFSIPSSESPVTPLAIALPDVTFGGTRSRTSQMEAGVGIDHQFNERERLAADVSATATRFSRLGQAGYRYATVTTAYRRQLSQRTTGQASLRVGISDYLGQTSQDGVIITSTVGIITQLSRRLTLEAGAGISVIRVRDPLGDNSSRVVPAAQAKFCERGIAGSTCVSASRESQPTALRGLSNVTNISFSHTGQIDQRDGFSSYASYTKTGGAPGRVLEASAAELLTASATYNRNFDRRFAGFFTTSYTRLLGAGTRRVANPALRIGFRYRFGGVA